MFKIIFLVSLFACPIQAAIPPPIKDPKALIGNEIVKINTLIHATECSLEAQKKLYAQIMEYNQLQEQYLKNSKDNDLLLKLVKSAYRTLQTIKDNHLELNFDADFIDELTVMSQPIKKRGIPRP